MENEPKVEITPTELKTFLRFAYVGQSKDWFKEPLVNYLGALIFGSKFPSEKNEDWDDVYNESKMQSKMRQMFKKDWRSSKPKKVRAVRGDVAQSPSNDTEPNGDRDGEINGGHDA